MEFLISGGAIKARRRHCSGRFVKFLSVGKTTSTSLTHVPSDYIQNRIAIHEEVLFRWQFTWGQKITGFYSITKDLDAHKYMVVVDIILHDFHPRNILS
ncbi:hypothetical protein Glove_59g13 [Diversispora epigaea]|uniref:Uncharacterized protein n=1 Tax=Diversispora epigaea TaxID=1348612 RepID=A0A397JE83_9GLOM|nr:hypothetical protein Glove_59g13 [Diversispora epigaea]